MMIRIGQKPNVNQKAGAAFHSPANVSHNLYLGRKRFQRKKIKTTIGAAEVPSFAHCAIEVIPEN